MTTSSKHSFIRSFGTCNHTLRCAWTDCYILCLKWRHAQPRLLPLYLVKHRFGIVVCLRDDLHDLIERVIRHVVLPLDELGIGQHFGKLGALLDVDRPLDGLVLINNGRRDDPSVLVECHDAQLFTRPLRRELRRIFSCGELQTREGRAGRQIPHHVVRHAEKGSKGCHGVVSPRWVERGNVLHVDEADKGGTLLRDELEESRQFLGGRDWQVSWYSCREWRQVAKPWRAAGWGRKWQVANAWRARWLFRPLLWQQAQGVLGEALRIFLGWWPWGEEIWWLLGWLLFGDDDGLPASRPPCAFAAPQPPPPCRSR
mmetsp:Transcript_8055/g.19836  ORF Transcript_8055/g.19836 Transcript_8055/m.19836 type:complete len:314 (+) Transcript_8055:560-1501(+)